MTYIGALLGTWTSTAAITFLLSRGKFDWGRFWSTGIIASLLSCGIIWYMSYVRVVV